MAFSFLRNPFEKLSADNQQQMVDELKTVNQMLGTDGVMGMLSVISENTTSMVEELREIHITLQKNGAAGGSNNAINEDELEKMGVASMTLGGGMEKIITAIKIFSKIPADTIDLFIEGMEKLGKAFKELSEGMQVIDLAGKALLNMAKGIIFFGLALLLSGPIYLLALPLAPIVIGIVLGVMWLFTKVLGDKESMEGIEAGGRALMWMAGGILLFGIALLLAGPIYMMAMTKSLFLVAAVVVGAFILMSLLDTFSDTITDGIQALMWMGIAIVVFGIALILAIPLYEYLWKSSEGGLLIIGLVLLPIIGLMLLLSLARKGIYEGAKAMVVIGIAIIVLGLALWLFSKVFPANKQNWATLDLVDNAIFGLVVSLLLLSLNSKKVMQGAIALLIATAAVVVLAYGLQKWMDAKVTDDQFDMVGLAIIGLTVALTVMGLVGIMVIAGAAALLLASAAVVVLAYGMGVWMKAGVTEDDAIVLTAMIVALGLVATVLGNPFTSWMAVIGASVMILIGVALVEMADAVATFKASKATVKDAEVISDIVGVLAGAFALVTKEGGDGWDWKDVRRGVFAMQNLGTTLTGIAEGVQAFANLTISEYEYDEKSGKMVEKRRIQLTKQDFIRVGDGIASMINALADPLAKVGAADAGDTSTEFGSMFGGKGLVRKGVRALEGVGNVLTGLAAGVQAFANLTISKWEMKPDSKGVMTMTETERIKMTDTMIKDAGMNMMKVVGVAAAMFAKIGIMESKNEGMFGGGYVTKGVEAMSGAGTIVVDMAKGIQDFANLKFTTYKVVNAGTPDAKIVPDEIVTMDETMILKASKNMMKVVGVSALMFNAIGVMSESGSGMFSGGYMEKGIDAMSGAADVVTGLAKGIQDFANLRFTSYKVIDVKGVPTIVPDKITSLSKADIIVAGKNMESVLSVSFNALVNFGIKNNKKFALIPTILGIISQITEGTKGVADSMVDMANGISKIGDFATFGTNIQSFLEAFINPFDIEKNPGAEAAAARFTVFTADVERIANAAKEMESIDESFENIANSMGVFKDNVNSLDIELLSETRGLFEAMAVIADAGSADDIMAKYGATLEATFENLAALLKDFGGTVAEGAEKTATAADAQTKSNEGMGEVLKKQQKTAEALPPTAAAQSGNMGAQLDEIASILRGTLKVKGGGGF